jgi:hypothetical protein
MSYSWKMARMFGKLEEVDHYHKKIIIKIKIKKDKNILYKKIKNFIL